MLNRVLYCCRTPRVLLSLAPPHRRSDRKPLLEEVAQAWVAVIGSSRPNARARGTGEPTVSQNMSPQPAPPTFADTELRPLICEQALAPRASREPICPTEIQPRSARLGYDGVAYDILADGTARAPCLAPMQSAPRVLYHPID